jgi:hypothetical protein
MTQEPGPDGKTALRVKAVFNGTNAGTAPVPITITRALFLTAKGELSMVVRGAKDEPFTRQYDPNVPKLFEYGAILPPRWPPGTRALVVFDLESGGVKKSIRTPLQTVAK